MSTLLLSLFVALEKVLWPRILYFRLEGYIFSFFSCIMYGIPSGRALVDPIHYAAKKAENTTPRRKYNILGQNTFPRAPKSGQHLQYFTNTPLRCLTLD